jgi:hypothetical protein
MRMVEEHEHYTKWFPKYVLPRTKTVCAGEDLPPLAGLDPCHKYTHYTTISSLVWSVVVQTECENLLNVLPKEVLSTSSFLISGARLMVPCHRRVAV